MTPKRFTCADSAPAVACSVAVEIVPPASCAGAAGSPLPDVIAWTVTGKLPPGASVAGSCGAPLILKAAPLVPPIASAVSVRSAEPPLCTVTICVSAGLATSRTPVRIAPLGHEAVTVKPAGVPLPPEPPAPDAPAAPEAPAMDVPAPPDVPAVPAPPRPPAPPPLAPPGPLAPPRPPLAPPEPLLATCAAARRRYRRAPASPLPAAPPEPLLPVAAPPEPPTPFVPPMPPVAVTPPVPFIVLPGPDEQATNSNRSRIAPRSDRWTGPSLAELHDGYKGSPADGRRNMNAFDDSRVVSMSRTEKPVVAAPAR